MSKTVAQIFAINPVTTILNNDLFYLVNSPYTPGTDAAISGSSLKALFLQPANNLSDLSNVSTARTNLGLTALATATPPLSGTLGGTGVNNGASLITIGGNLTFSGAFSFTGTLSNTTNITFPTSGTLATTSQLPTPSALTSSNDTNVTITLGGTPATSLLQTVSLTMGWTGQLGLTRGGTNASLTASNGGIVWSNATQLQILTGTATAGQMLQSGASVTPAWSTTTYPATNAINTLLYASSANVMAALATVNSAFLTTSSGGVPTWNTNQPFVRTNIQKFTASGTYTPTTGTKYAIMECIGNGGGGGGAASSTGAASGGGGGAGSYSRVVVTAASIGASQTVTVGATGTGGTAGNNAGTNGGDVSIGTLCVGKGGTGGNGAAANSSAAGGAGGVAGTGDVTSVGNGGTGGGGATITTASVPRGIGAASFLGGAPTGQQYIQSTGNAGNNYGAGGNGGYSFAAGGNAAGGTGSTGIAIITEFIFQ